MNWRIRNFLQDSNELIRFGYKRYGVTKNERFFRFSFGILEDVVDNIRTPEDCINSKYWNCLENVMLMSSVANKHGLVSKVTVVQNVSYPNGIHCILKINNHHFDNMILQGKLEQVQLEPGLNYKLIDIPEIHPGMNRKDVIRMISNNIERS